MRICKRKEGYTMANTKHLFEYTGAVVIHERTVANNWKGRTFAVSEKQAKSHLAYRYKKENGFTASIPVCLPGKLIRVEDD